MPPDIETFSYPHRNSEYSYRVPTPPRIVVPPPALNQEALPDITLNTLRSTNLDFLKNVTYGSNLIKENALLEWSYERRREAQMIIPYIFLGPMNAAKDEKFLRNAGGTGITMVLGIRQKHSFESKLLNGALRKVTEMGMERHTVDLANNQDLIHSFPATTALINDHLARVHQATGQLGKVFIFCESGNERSAGVVAAYLMEMHDDVDYIKAMQLVQAQRFCANFDDAMKRLLQGYWDILCAKRQVAAMGNDNSNGNGTLNISPSNKRSLQRDDHDDADVTMDDDDAERFGGRTFTPFGDKSLE